MQGRKSCIGMSCLWVCLFEHGDMLGVDEQVVFPCVHYRQRLQCCSCSGSPFDQGNVCKGCASSVMSLVQVSVGKRSSMTPLCCRLT